MGAWIEISQALLRCLLTYLSHPSWVRGLKSKIDNNINDTILVAPLVGAWIEIEERLNIIIYINVAPLVGAWIEIFFLNL